MTKKEITNILYNVLKVEARKNNLEFDMHIVTLKEFKKSDYANKHRNLKTRKFKTKNKNTLVFGLTDIFEYQIFLFIDNILCNTTKKRNLKINKTNSIVPALAYGFHELRHLIQKNEQNPYSFINFVSLIENNLKSEYYSELYNKFYLEIDADLYGIRKSEEYVKDYMPKLLASSQKYLNFYKEIYIERQNDYYLNIKDEEKNMFDIFYKNIIGEEPIEGCELGIIRKNKALAVFLNYDGSFKCINDIILNPDFNNLDNRIIFLVCNSNIFRKSLQNLTEEENNFIIALDELKNKINKNVDFETMVNEEMDNYKSLLNSKNQIRKI